MSKLTGLGWNIHIDVTQLKYIFDVKLGKNLTVNQNELPPAIFSPKFNSVGKLSYTECDLNYRNAAIVAGQGEGVERRILKVGESEGFDRHELFVDARDVEEVIDDVPVPVQDIVDRLMNRGQQKLAEQQHEFYLEGQTLQKSPLEYEIDYDLGDIVTLQNVEWGVTLDTRITEVKEIFERDGRKIELIFGNRQPTLVDKIKQGFSVFKPEMTR
ncbi:hypothetical protein G8O30_15935 (plasmid) [Mangrovibacillus cuniculi]|uniref:Gp28/Gp37-like domain-containing protein n=1 Tax=Mangrovibacillus cuniculi TaxID=2593652 RepID=A0A7S8CEJ6_9BACI|nr:hypothetical protein G8O30_15935 [Mangrovibacillus cuniculi]